MSAKNLKYKVYMLKVVLSGVVLFFLICVLFYIYFSSLSINVDLPTLVVFYALFNLSIFVTITPGNLGVREIACGFISEQMRIGMAQGILVSTLVRVVETCIVFVFGLIFGGADLLYHRKDYFELKG